MFWLMFLLSSMLSRSSRIFQLLNWLGRGLLYSALGGVLSLLCLSAKADYTKTAGILSSPFANVDYGRSSSILASSIKNAPSLSVITAAGDVLDGRNTEYFSSLYINGDSIAFPGHITPEKTQELLSLVPNGMPLKSFRRISSEFGMRFHPLKHKYHAHRGMDFSVASGTPVFVTAHGTVTVADNSNRSSYGKHVVVRHSLGFSTLYAHLNKVSVKPGEQIGKGGQVGLSGNTGRSSNPHLHYEIKYLGQALNPKSFTTWSVENFHAIFNEEKSVPWAHIREQKIALSELTGVTLPQSETFVR